MGKREREERSGLLAAAEAFDAELRRFDTLAEAIQKAPLNSQKNLERAAHAFTEVASVDERLAAVAKTLVEEIAVMRDRQAAQAQGIQQRALELQERTGVFQGLLQQYGALGQDAIALNGLVQALAAKKREASTQEDAVGLLRQVEEVQAGMARVAAAAAALVQTADERDFGDLARQADSLRQQLLGARNKMGLLHKSLSA